MTTAGILSQQITLHSGEIKPVPLPSTVTFFHHFVVFDTRILQQDLLTNVSTIYPPALTVIYRLHCPLIASTNVFYPLAVTGRILLPDLFINTSTIYAPMVVFAATTRLQSQPKALWPVQVTKSTLNPEP